jgi:hypothetical protein
LSQITSHLQFSIDFGVPVWQMRHDYEEKLLALEIRDGDRLQTEFAAVAVETGNLVGSSYRATENWWIGLEEAQNRQIYLHGFADRKVGSHRGITAVAMDTWQIKWQLEEGVYFGLADKYSLIARPAPGEANQYIALDSRTGQIIETAIDPVRAHSMVAEYAQKRSLKAQYPVHHPEGSTHFTLLGQFITAKTGQIPVKAVDYLETGTFFALAFYVPIATGKLKHTLGVYSVQDGLQLLETVLAEAGSGVVTDPYFMMQETLIFVQEQHTLWGYQF